MSILGHSLFKYIFRNVFHLKIGNAYLYFSIHTPTDLLATLNRDIVHIVLLF